MFFHLKKTIFIESETNKKNKTIKVQLSSKKDIIQIINNIDLIIQCLKLESRDVQKKNTRRTKYY